MSNERLEHQENIIEFTRGTDESDADFSHLRGEGVLNKLLRCYPKDADKLHRAHERLKGDPNYGRAMHQAALSFHEGHIRAFVSYREEADREAAREIASVCRELSAGRVIVNFADEFTTRIPGQNFKSTIECDIKSAHWFIILVSEVQEPSGWCMYETGMFQAKMTSKKMERLICIYHPSAKLPDAIADYQAVKACDTELLRFLEGLFRKSDPLPGWDALNPELTNETLRGAATRIANAFRPPRKPVSFNYRVTLEIRNPAKLGAWSDLASCAIETDLRTADLFGKIEPPLTWGKLIENVLKKNNTQKWLEELLAVVKRASEGNAFRPITGTFECSHNGRVMRPVLHAMEYDGASAEYKFHLFFLEEICSAPVHSIPPSTLALLTAVRMNNRIRWEIIQRFSNISLTHSDIDACTRAFSRIEREVQSFGQWDVNLLCSNYDQNVQADIKLIVQKWQELRKPGVGELNIALEQHDGDKLQKILSECRELNKQFFVLTFPILEDVYFSRVPVTFF